MNVYKTLTRENIIIELVRMNHNKKENMKVIMNIIMEGTDLMDILGIWMRK
jgi:hypothetical protein